MSETMYKCTICEREWPELPAGTVQLTTTKRGGRGHATTYRFPPPDGGIHVITKQRVSVPSQDAQEKIDVI
jgi:hypothetical protein